MNFIVTLASLSFQDNDNLSSEDETDRESDDDLPPLIKVHGVSPSEVPVMENSANQSLLDPGENSATPTLYPVAMVNFDKDIDSKSNPPPLVNKDTGELVEEVLLFLMRYNIIILFNTEIKTTTKCIC